MEIYGEMQSAFDCVTNLIREEQIECHYQQCGRFMAANTPSHYDAMARELDIKRPAGFSDEVVVHRDTVVSPPLHGALQLAR